MARILLRITSFRADAIPSQLELDHKRFIGNFIVKFNRNSNFNKQSLIFRFIIFVQYIQSLFKLYAFKPIAIIVFQSVLSVVLCVGKNQNLMRLVISNFEIHATNNAIAKLAAL